MIDDKLSKSTFANVHARSEAKYRTDCNEEGDHWILCLVCGYKSFSMEDVKFRYCSYCHEHYNPEEEG